MFLPTNLQGRPSSAKEKTHNTGPESERSLKTNTYTSCVTDSRLVILVALIPPTSVRSHPPPLRNPHEKSILLAADEALVRAAGSVRSECKVVRSFVEASTVPSVL